MRSIRERKPYYGLTGKKASLVPLCREGRIKERKCRKYRHLIR